jgi:hypothetical protein
VQYDRAVLRSAVLTVAEWVSANWRSERCAVTKVILGCLKADFCGSELQGAPEAGDVDRLLTDRE